MKRLTNNHAVHTTQAASVYASIITSTRSEAATERQVRDFAACVQPAVLL